MRRQWRLCRNLLLLQIVTRDYQLQRGPNYEISFWEPVSIFRFPVYTVQLAITGLAAYQEALLFIWKLSPAVRELPKSTNPCGLQLWQWSLRFRRPHIKRLLLFIQNLSPAVRRVPMSTNTRGLQLSYYQWSHSFIHMSSSKPNRRCYSSENISCCEITFKIYNYRHLGFN